MDGNDTVIGLVDFFAYYAILVLKPFPFTLPYHRYKKKMEFCALLTRKCLRCEKLWEFSIVQEFLKFRMSLYHQSLT